MEPRCVRWKRLGALMKIHFSEGGARVFFCCPRSADGEEGWARQKAASRASDHPLDVMTVARTRSLLLLNIVSMN